MVWSWLREERIDERLRRELGGAPLTSFSVHTRSLPGFRFVDLHRAAEAVAGRAPGVQVLDTESGEDLNNLFHGPAQQWVPRALRRAPRTSLRTDDFQVALEEMQRFGDDAASRIIGFGASR